MKIIRAFCRVSEPKLIHYIVQLDNGDERHLYTPRDSALGILLIKEFDL